jgi:hypothetical protein
LTSPQFDPTTDSTSDRLLASDWHHLHSLTRDFNSILTRIALAR